MRILFYCFSFSAPPNEKKISANTVKVVHERWRSAQSECCWTKHSANSWLCFEPFEIARNCLILLTYFQFNAMIFMFLVLAHHINWYFLSNTRCFCFLLGDHLHIVLTVKFFVVSKRRKREKVQNASVCSKWLIVLQNNASRWIFNRTLRIFY